MFMVSDDIKVALLTEHVPIDDVVSQITPLLIKKRITPNCLQVVG